jgi:hypothetical protein
MAERALVEGVSGVDVSGAAAGVSGAGAEISGAVV